MYNMDNRTIKPRYTSWFKTSTKNTVLKVFSSLRVLGYVCPDDVVEYNKTYVVYTFIDENGLGHATCVSLDVFNETTGYLDVNCFNNFAYFLAVAAVNDENDYHQFFVYDEDINYGPLIGRTPKGSFFYCYGDKHMESYKCHKADADELYDKYYGDRQDIDVSYLPQEVEDMLKTCKGYDSHLYGNYRTIEWVHKWLRVRHGLYIYVVPRFDGFDHAQYDCNYEIYRPGMVKSMDLYGDGSYCYDDAMITAIRECLEHHVPHIEDINTTENEKKN